MKFTYPLKLTFQLIALAPRVRVLDPQGQELFYIEQKVFALKEAVKVFNNSQEKKLLYTIKADQIIDIGARYFIRTPEEKAIGSVQQEGMRSFFQGSYIVFDANDQETYKVTQANPWVGMLDSLINIIPFAEFVTGYILNPTYTIAAKDETAPTLTMKKKPSFFESQFEINTVKNDLPESHELLLILSLLMIVQLEQNRS